MEKGENIVTADSVVNKVNKRFNLDVTTKSRKEEHVAVRSALAAAMRNCMKFGPSEIGRAIKRNHATVIHCVKNHEWFYNTKSSYGEQYTHWYDTFAEFIPKRELTKHEIIEGRFLVGIF